MCIVVKQEGRVVEFDIKNICEVILKALESLEPVFEKDDETDNKIIVNLGRVKYTFAHSLAHLVLHALFKITVRIKETICFDPYSAIRLSTALCIRVELLITPFLEYVHVCRTVRPHRTQDRCVDDNSDSDMIDINFRNYIPVDITKRRSLNYDTFRKLYRGFNG